MKRSLLGKYPHEPSDKRTKLLQKVESLKRFDSSIKHTDNNYKISEQVSNDSKSMAKESRKEGKASLLLEFQKKMAAKNEQKKQIDLLQRQYDDSKKQCQILEKQVSAAEAKIQQLLKCSDSGKKISDTGAETKIQQLEIENAELLKSIRAKDAVNIDQKKQHDHEYQKWIDEKEAKNDEINRLQMQVKKLRQQMLEHQSKAEQANLRAENLTDELSCAAKKFGEMDQQIAELQKKLKSVDEINRNLNQIGGGDLDRFVVEHVGVQVDEYVDEMRSKDAELALAKAELVDLNARFDAFKAESKTEKQKVAMKFEAIEASYQQLSATNALLDEEKEKLKAELLAAQKVTEDLQKSAKEEKQKWALQYSEQLKKISTKEAAIDELLKQLSENEEHCKFVEHQIFVAKTSTQKVEAELLKTQKTLKEKEQQIREHQNAKLLEHQLHGDWIQKAKFFEAKLIQSREQLSAANEEMKEWKAKCGILELQCKKAEIDLVREKEGHAKVVEEMKALQAQIDHLTSSNTSMKVEKEKLEQKVVKAQAAINDKMSQIHKLQNQQAGQRKANDEWTLKAKAAISQLTESNTKLTYSAAEIKQRNGDLERSMKKIEAVAAAAKETHEKIVEEMKGENEKLRASNASMKAELEQLAAEYASTIDESAKLELKFDDLQKEHNAKVKSHQEWVQNAKSVMARYLRSEAKLEAKCIDLQRQLEHDIMAYSNDIEELKARIERLTAANATKKVEKQKLEQQLVQLQKQQIEKDESHQKWIQNAKTIMAQYLHSEAKLKVKCANLQNRLKEHESTAARSESCAATANEKEVQRQVIEEMKAKNERLTAENASMQVEKQQLQQQLLELQKSLKTSINPDGDQAQAIITQLRQSEAQLKASEALLKTKCINLEAQFAQLQSTTTAEKEVHQKVVKELKAKSIQMAAINATMKCEKEKAEKEFSDFQEVTNNRKLKMQNFLKKICNGIGIVESSAADKNFDAAAAGLEGSVPGNNLIEATSQA